MTDKYFEADILSSLEDVVYSASYPELKLFYVTPSIFQLVGYLPEEFINQKIRWTDLVHPEDKHLIDKVYEQIKISGEYKVRYKLVTKNNEIKYIQNRGRVIKDKNNLPIRLDGLINDITELLHIKTDLKNQSTEIQNLLLENEMVFHGTQDAMFLIEVTQEQEYIIRRVNKAYEEATGITQEFVKGKTPIDLLGETVGKQIINNYINCINQGIPISYEESVENLASSKTWTTALSPVFINNQIRYIVGASKDITEQKKAKETLKKSNERFDLILEASSDGWFDRDLIKNEVIYSRKWWLNFGDDTNPNEVAPNYWISLIHPEDKNRVLEYVSTMFDSQYENFDVSFRMLHRSNHYVYVLSRCFIQRDIDGRAIRMVGSNIDLTDRKRLENTLREAKEMAESANQAKGVFLTNMSHEIRTPLNGIIGFSELLLQSGLTLEQKDYIQNIFSSGKNLLSLVNQVLDFSKIDSGKFDLEYISIDLVDLIKSTIHIFESQAKAKFLHLTSTLDTNLPQYVYLDPLRVRQVLSNLIGNAIKFTNSGQITIQIHLLETKDGIANILFSIEDSGIGIEFTAQSKLFESFAQADSSITRKYGGTGLGLTITSELLQKMNSKLEFESLFGVGSKFYFILELPITMTGSVASNLFHEKDNFNSELKHKVNPRCTKDVLVVEDNELNRILVTKLLLKKYPNVQIQYAKDGIEAISQVQIKKPDIIFMDIQMPNMDGYTATKNIRTIYGLNKTPIIALTAGAFIEIKNQAIEAGMDDFLTKPISSSQLYEVFERWSPLSSVQ
ncbi:PAS domain-containing protein [Leptospira sp. 96542]|nr:PAS domain-containing protein [Leptospira sp. 96542]